MRLAISNLAWPRGLDEVAFDLLARLGVRGVEIAPTRIADWDALSKSRLADYRTRIEACGLMVSSLQAVLFSQPQLQLFGGEGAFNAMLEHMRRVASIGQVVGAGVLVFGAPYNRRVGEMQPDRAWDLARERFRAIGDATLAYGVITAIEPIPAIYDGDFLTSWSDVLRMVKEVGHPGVRVHLDTGCVALDGGSIEAAITESQGMLSHFHAAQPQLLDFQDPLPDHAVAAAALRASGYDLWVAVEMREQVEDPVAAVECAIRAAQRIYGL